MENYSPEVKMFYGPINSVANRLIPAPEFSLSVDFNYANDTVIGYTYIISLVGQITALDLRSISGSYDLNAQNITMDALVDHIEKVRNTLNHNGRELFVVNKDNATILKASGGILRSFEISESANNWVSSANYTATIEFNSLEFLGAYWQSHENDNCADIFLDSSTYSADGILDITKHKIKSFQDSWSITLDDTASYSRVKNTEMGSALNIDNNTFNIEYTISATGKHFYVTADHALPAWEQAKNFVQKRLYDQVTNLLNGVLDNRVETCPPILALNALHKPANNDYGLLKDLGNSKYAVYNEVISCDVSEAEGSFSATYTALVKSQENTATWTSPDTKHTVSKSVNSTNNVGVVTKSLTINGTIEGLLAGGLINAPQPLELPRTGSFMVYKQSSTNKYNVAKAMLDQIYSDTDYASGLGVKGKRDLKKPFKDILNITSAYLGLTDPDPAKNPNDPPHPTSFNLTHDYNAGIITYSVEYGGNLCSNKRITSVSINTKNPTKVIALFNIPSSQNCPVIQELGTYTAKSVSVSIQGFDFSLNGQPEQPIDLTTLIDCGTCASIEYLPVIPALGTNPILTQQSYTHNPLDGSYSVNLEYICSPSCTI